MANTMSWREREELVIETMGKATFYPQLWREFREWCPRQAQADNFLEEFVWWLDAGGPHGMGYGGESYS